MEVSNEERTDFIRRWVTALRSGDYNQAKYVLYNGYGYCCLGVACTVEGLEPKLKYLTEYYFDETDVVLPISMRNRYGLEKGGNLFIPDVGDVDLSVLNDSEEFTFDQIADLLEWYYNAY